MFLVLATRLARADGGRVAFVQPLSMLATRDGGWARAAVRDLASVEHLWIASENVFAADVATCAIGLCRGRTQGPSRANPRRGRAGRPRPARRLVGASPRRRARRSERRAPDRSHDRRRRGSDRRLPRRVLRGRVARRGRWRGRSRHHLRAHRRRARAMGRGERDHRPPPLHASHESRHPSSRIGSVRASCPRSSSRRRRA